MPAKLLLAFQRGRKTASSASNPPKTAGRLRQRFASCHRRPDRETYIMSGKRRVLYSYLPAKQISAGQQTIPAVSCTSVLTNQKPLQDQDFDGARRDTHTHRFRFSVRIVALRIFQISHSGAQGQCVTSVSEVLLLSYSLYTLYTRLRAASFDLVTSMTHTPCPACNPASLKSSRPINSCLYPLSFITSIPNGIQPLAVYSLNLHYGLPH